MKFDPPLVHGTLIKRYKRFLADVRLDDGREVTAHCPNPGSMRTCAEPGWGVWLSPSTNPKRKLKWTLEIIDADGTPILVNTGRPNTVVREAVEAGDILEVSGYDALRAEVRYGENSRIDLFLTAADRPDCYLEVKNVTMGAEPAVAAFPDSVSKRAAKHMAELTAQVEAGHRSVVVFLVSRGDARAMRPAEEIDPTYAQALRAAVAAGVEVLAYRAVITPTEVTVGERVEVRL